MATRATRIDLASPSGRPLYLQLVDWLRGEIAGQKPGARVDSEPELARRFGVSRFTVSRAIEILVDEGLIRRRQGLGSFVAPPPLRRQPSYLTSFTDAVEAQGRVDQPPPAGLRRDGVARRSLSLSAGAEARPPRPACGSSTASRPRSTSRCSRAEVARRIGLTRNGGVEPEILALSALSRKPASSIERGVETLRAGAATARSAAARTRRRRGGHEGARAAPIDSDGALIDVVRRRLRRAPLRLSGRNPRRRRSGCALSFRS